MRELCRIPAKALAYSSGVLDTKEAVSRKADCSSGKGKGRTVVTTNRPLRHVARSSLLESTPAHERTRSRLRHLYPEQGRLFVDLERGIFYRKQIGKRATKKGQTPAPIPRWLLAQCTAGLG
jgi:hypothetical protein